MIKPILITKIISENEYFLMKYANANVIQNSKNKS